MDQIVSWLERHHIGLTTLLATIALLIGAATVILVLDRLLKNALRRADARLGLRSEYTVIVARAVNSILWLVTLLFVLDLWGIGVGGLWAVLASIATLIGVGFLANWAMVSNITASLFLAIWRPFRLGDTVELLPENLKGRAVDRNLMFTALREDGGTVLQIPNNLFFQKIFRIGDGHAGEPGA
jgi:small-conductance mechanosensitive channel